MLGGRRVLYEDEGALYFLSLPLLYVQGMKSANIFAMFLSSLSYFFPFERQLHFYIGQNMNLSCKFKALLY